MKSRHSSIRGLEGPVRSFVRSLTFYLTIPFFFWLVRGSTFIIMVLTKTWGGSTLSWTRHRCRRCPSTLRIRHCRQQVHFHADTKSASVSTINKNAVFAHMKISIDKHTNTTRAHESIKTHVHQHVCVCISIFVYVNIRSVIMIRIILWHTSLMLICIILWHTSLMLTV